MVCAFCVPSKKCLLCSRSKIFSSMFSSRNFIVSTLTFRSIVHFKLIFLYDVNWVLRSLLFFFFANVCPTIPVSFVEKTIFSSLNHLDNSVWYGFLYDSLGFMELLRSVDLSFLSSLEKFCLLSFKIFFGLLFLLLDSSYMNVRPLNMVPQFTNALLFQFSFLCVLH